MKKVLQIVVMLATLLMGTQMAFAYEAGFSEVTTCDTPALLKIKTMAIAMPWYSNPEPGQATKEDAIDILAKTSGYAKDSIKVESYYDVCRDMKAKHQIDVAHLERRKAFSYYKKYVGEFADAYLLLTVSNDTRLNLFYEVYNSNTNELIFVYHKQAPKGDRNIELYTEMTSDFYKKLDSVIKEEKQKKEKEEKAILLLQQKK